MTFDISTKYCEYSNGVLTVSKALKNPGQEYNVLSHRTGRIVKFIYHIDDMMQNEFYDGLFVTYKPTEECGIKKLVIRCE